MRECEVTRALPWNLYYSMSVPPLDERLTSSLSFLLLTSAGLAAYAIILYTLYKFRKEFHQKHNCYLLVWLLAFGDLGILLAQLIVAVPLSITGRPLYGL